MNREYPIEKLVHGGMGIARNGADAIFVPYVIPQETVRLEIEPGSKKPMRAVATEILSPSPYRVEPRCPLFGKCGGCQFQHIDYDFQLKIKRDILAEDLERIAKLRPTINETIASPLRYNYRSRVRLHCKNGKVGFFAEKRKEFLPLDYCHLADELINKAIPALSEIIESQSPDAVEITAEADGHATAAVEKKRLVKIYRAPYDDLGKWTLTENWKIAFQQINAGQNAALKKIIEDEVAEAAPETVVELYAGSGNLTENISKHAARVIAVDSDKKAIKMAIEKFGNSLAGNCGFVNMNADDYLKVAVHEKMKPDLIALDPPRVGAKEAVPGILKLNPRTIIYVSCNTATLARDAKLLTDGGYSVVSVTPMDMFPQTAHIEAIAVLRKNEP